MKNCFNWSSILCDIDGEINVSEPLPKSISNYKLIINFVNERTITKMRCGCEHDCCGHICSRTYDIERSENYIFLTEYVKYNY